MEDGRSDHVTVIFILHLLLALFSFAVKLSSVVFASKARISSTILIYVLVFSRKDKRDFHVSCLK